MRRPYFYLPFLGCFFMFTWQLSGGPLPMDVNAEAAILMNAETGVVLFEKNSRHLRDPASTTKIATAIYFLHTKGSALDQVAAVSQEAMGVVSKAAKIKAGYKGANAYYLIPGSSHMGLKRGEEMSVRDLLYGTMLISGDDASNVLAEQCSGNISNFMQGLNGYLKEIGCTSTTYRNPHGLYHPEHKTTAYDLAWMTREALKNATFREIVSTVRYPLPQTNKKPSTVIIQTNRLIVPKSKGYYEKAIGVKTGYINESGHCLVAAAKQDSRTLIAVVMGCKERAEIFAETKKMLEAAYAQAKEQKRLLKEGLQTLTMSFEGGREPLQTYLKSDVVVEYYPAEMPEFFAKLHWKELSLPVAKDQEVGEIELVDTTGTQIMYIPLLAFNEVRPTFWMGIKIFCTEFGVVRLAISALVCVGVLSLVAYFFFSRRRKRRPSA